MNALNVFTSGKLIKSQEVNENFTNIVEEIQSLATIVQNNKDSVESSISSSNSSITNSINESKEELQNKIETLFTDNGVFFKKTVSGDNLCLEYFSDSAKTKRVLMLLFGKTVGFTNVTFTKKFTTLFGIFAQVITKETCVSAAIDNPSKSGFHITDGTHGGHHEDRYNLQNYWFAIGV